MVTTLMKSAVDMHIDASATCVVIIMLSLSRGRAKIRTPKGGV